MKSLSEKTDPAGQINRETALGLLAANMAVPGVGTFLAGKRLIGTIQVVVGFAGMGVTVVMGVKMAVWMLSNWGQLHDPDADPSESLRSLWLVSRWPLAGIAMFAVSWLWSVAASLRLVRRCPPPSKPIPPKL